MKSSVLGAIFAVAMLVLLLPFLSGAPDNASFIESINPVEAVKHLAFAFGFGAGLPTPLAVITAVGVLILIPVATFLVVRSIARRFDSRTHA
jgi:hypothetical protein